MNFTFLEAIMEKKKCPWHLLRKSHSLAVSALFCPEVVINDYQKVEETKCKFYVPIVKLYPHGK